MRSREFIHYLSQLPLGVRSQILRAERAYVARVWADNGRHRSEIRDFSESMVGLREYPPTVS